MARVIVDVVLKPEILDPQGQAIAGALHRLGVSGVRDVRQGKHFELDVAEDVDDATLTRVADTLLANPVIETFDIRRDAGDAPDHASDPDPVDGPSVGE